MRRVCLSALVALAVLLRSAPGVAAPEPKLKDVLARVASYLEQFEAAMASVVADEEYRQTLVLTPKGAAARALRFSGPASNVPQESKESMMLRSDYALVRTADGRWVGYRDTFEVDGRPVRDREQRLLRLLSRGDFVAASAIRQESSRFNLGSDIILRTVNVPVLAVELLSGENQWRLSLRKAGEETIDGVRLWRIEFREREHPTFVRTTRGHDQPSLGYALIDPTIGHVWRTSVGWKEIDGSVEVTYGRVSNLDVLAPVSMTERYDPDAALITGVATYSNYRRFTTSARMVSP